MRAGSSGNGMASPCGSVTEITNTMIASTALFINMLACSEPEWDSGASQPAEQEERYPWRNRT